MYAALKYKGVSWVAETIGGEGITALCTAFFLLLFFYYYSFNPFSEAQGARATTSLPNVTMTRKKSWNVSSEYTVQDVGLFL
jgi:hypothetical protein